MGFVTIDFEASCLPKHGRSFPIEVAISGAEGTRSWLIRPHPSWHGWHWSGEASALHGLSLGSLETEGIVPAVVMRELTAAIGDRRVFADSMLDAGWWSTLAGTGVTTFPCPIEHARHLLDELDATAEAIGMAKAAADTHCPGRHRAGPDARWLWRLLSELTEMMRPGQALRVAA